MCLSVHVFACLSATQEYFISFGFLFLFANVNFILNMQIPTFIYKFICFWHISNLLLIFNYTLAK